MIFIRDTIGKSVLKLEFPLFRQKKFRRNFFFDGIHDTEYGIPAELRKNSVSTEYGIPYSAEFSKNTEFRNIRISVKYGIPHCGIPYIRDITRAGEPVNFLAAPAPAPCFFLSGSGSCVFFKATPAYFSVLKSENRPFILNIWAKK